MNSAQAIGLRKLAAEEGWKAEHFDVASIIRALLKNVADEGYGVDSGGGPDAADLWFRLGGVEYYLNVRRSNNQLAKDAAASE